MLFQTSVYPSVFEFFTNSNPTVEIVEKTEMPEISDLFVVDPETIRIVDREISKILEEYGF